MTGSSRLPQSLLDRLGAELNARAGLEPPQWVLEARLWDRLAALGLESPEAYVDLLGSHRGAGELELLIETLRVGETRFFRHRFHVKALEGAVIPALKERDPKGPVKAWSAGCATGEEAYTLALLLARHLSGARVEVLATDISRDALEVARAGVYPDRALEPVPAPLRSFGFERRPEGGFKVSDHIASLVTFKRRNLADRPYPRGFDVIFCRNVLIYFSPEARQQTILRLIDSLEEGGFLFVGYAESLRDFSQLEALRTPDAVLYRKSARESRVPAPRSAPRGRSEPARRPGATQSPTKPAPRVTAETAVIELRGRYQGTLRLSRELAAALSGPYRSVVVVLDGADYLDDEAAAVLRRARSAARAAGARFSLVAHRAGPRRWLARSGLFEEEGE